MFEKISFGPLEEDDGLSNWALLCGFQILDNSSLGKILKTCQLLFKKSEKLFL